MTVASDIGVFDLFTIGIGPSSSHTVGPMRAAADFAQRLHAPQEVTRIEVELYGSLGATGAGHGTLDAVMLGLEGCRSDRLRRPEIAERSARMMRTGLVMLGGRHPVPLRTDEFVLSARTRLDRHSNAMRLRATDIRGETLAEDVYFSIGGGFIEREGDVPPDPTPAPLPYSSAAELLARCEISGRSIAQVVSENESARYGAAAVDEGIAEIRSAIEECVAAGIAASGILPGGLRVPRRAPAWHARLRDEDPGRDPAFWSEHVNLVALAVNEENAAGGRVVTAPTNGAAGIIPAVLDYALHYTPVAHDVSAHDGIARDFLLTAAAIGGIVKSRASISGAEVGCQGEVGSASAMAAGGLAAVLGGTPAQIENAAEIAMEHNLGLTCDPVGGLVQIPCIERNALAAVKAVNAARMAMWGDGTHHVSLDVVIETMRTTGADMSHKYKETALGGLAVNVVEC